MCANLLISVQIQKHLQHLPLIEQFQSSPEYQSVRHRASTPLNTIIMFVPQQEAWIVERMGKFNRILDPGLNVLIPFVDRVKYVQSLKEIAIDVPKQSAITVDNVTLGIDGVLYLRILDPYLGNYSQSFKYGPLNKSNFCVSFQLRMV